MKKQVVVVGLGRFGSSVATSLYNLGHDVLAIDKDQGRVQDMMGKSTHALTGNATDEHVFRELGIPAYDVAIVSIGSDLVSSVMASVLLKTIGVPYIVARAKDELHGNTLQRIGVDRVVHAESELGVRLAHTLFNPNVQEYLELMPNFGISKIVLPNRFDNMSIGELGFTGNNEKTGLSVLAVGRGRDVTLHPESDHKVRAGDSLVLAGHDNMLDDLGN